MEPVLDPIKEDPTVETTAEQSGEKIAEDLMQVGVLPVDELLGDAEEDEWQEALNRRKKDFVESLPEGCTLTKWDMMIPEDWSIYEHRPIGR